MFDRLREDIAVVFDRDPAARTRWEVLTCYPGLHALVWHRWVSHRLWGLGLRLFLLHDGRTTDLLKAIDQHKSSGSEANTAVLNFNALLPGQKQDVLNFLRSL